VPAPAPIPILRRVVPGRHALSPQLPDVIDSRGLTPYAVAKEAGIDPGRVARFVSGERDLRLATVDRIAAALGLRLVEVGRAKGRVRGRAIEDAPARPSGP
jgi:transcriptional regulator with XRE-family HTH domain